MCSKPGVGSLDLRGVLGARLNNPAATVNHGFDDADRNPSVDGFRGRVGILGVLHELLDPLRWETDFHGYPRPQTIAWGAVVRGACLYGKLQPVCTRDRPNLLEVVRTDGVRTTLAQVRGVEQVGVQVERYA